MMGPQRKSCPFTLGTFKVCRSEGGSKKLLLNQVHWMWTKHTSLGSLYMSIYIYISNGDGILHFHNLYLIYLHIYIRNPIYNCIYIYAHTSIPTSLCPTNPSACQVPVLATLFEGWMPASVREPLPQTAVECSSVVTYLRELQPQLFTPSRGVNYNTGANWDVLISSSACNLIKSHSVLANWYHRVHQGNNSEIT